MDESHIEMYKRVAVRVILDRCMCLLEPLNLGVLDPVITPMVLLIGAVGVGIEEIYGESRVIAPCSQNVST